MILFMDTDGGGGGGGDYSPWDTSSLPSNVTSSEGGFKLIRSGGSDGVRPVFHPRVFTTGKFAWQVVMVAGGSSSPGPACGIATGGAIGGYLGGESQDFGLWPNSSGTTDYMYQNNSNIRNGSWGSFSPSTAVQFVADFDAGYLWVRTEAVGFIGGGDPEAGTTPTATFTPGSYQAVFDGYYGGSAFLLTPPDHVLAEVAGFTPGIPD